MKSLMRIALFFYVVFIFGLVPAEANPGNGASVIVPDLGVGESGGLLPTT